MNSINTINTTIRRDFKTRLITFYVNANAQTYIDTLKIKIMDFLQILKGIVYVDAQNETAIANAIALIEDPQFNYSIPNPRNRQTLTQKDACITTVECSFVIFSYRP